MLEYYELSDVIELSEFTEPEAVVLAELLSQGLIELPSFMLPNE